jgi:hypothetical protein
MVYCTFIYEYTKILCGKCFTSPISQLNQLLIKMRKFWKNISSVENNDFLPVYGGEESLIFMKQMCTVGKI